MVSGSSRRRMRTILHIDFNSYFATVEQQANPRLRGKPIGVTGGDRMKRTVIGAASVEAKRFGVKTGMQIWEARKLCPSLILVPGDSDKYLEVTKRFLGILKDYSLHLEVFSIDECFLELSTSVIASDSEAISKHELDCFVAYAPRNDVRATALEIKSRIRSEIGEWITCSIGISYNKLMAKLAGSLQKPDGLVIIPDQKTAIESLNKVELDAVCGIGSRIKKRLFNMGVTDFRKLRTVPLPALLASFKSYGQVLFNYARGIDERPVIAFYEKPEVKSVGHRHTIDHDTADPVEIKQILLKLTELIARKLRAKKLVGRTVSCWFRYGFVHLRGGVENPSGSHLGGVFLGNGMQTTIPYTDDGLEIFHAGWKLFEKIWERGEIRMIGVSVSNLKPQTPGNLSFLEENYKREVITRALDKVNDKYGEFTLQRGVLLPASPAPLASLRAKRGEQTPNIRRMPNPFLADRKFRI
ncbi:MAG: Uncharacterized protein CEO21_114 [Microgenomates group bacterium Gr01-1014_80]|nr:MAG: Uncharacterized protein CEO21_114 [Microgenomates group bacterium Gr01-1014_80]